MRLFVVAILGAAVLSGCTAAFPAAAPSASPTPTTVANVIRAIRSVGAAAPFREPGVEMELASARGFPVRNEIVVLHIGSQMFLRSRYAGDGDTHVLLFFLTPGEFAALASGDPVAVTYGTGEDGGDRWQFGALDKRQLDRT